MGPVYIGVSQTQRRSIKLRFHPLHANSRLHSGECRREERPLICDANRRSEKADSVPFNRSMLESAEKNRRDASCLLHAVLRSRVPESIRMTRHYRADSVCTPSSQSDR